MQMAANYVAPFSPPSCMSQIALRARPQMRMMVGIGSVPHSPIGLPVHLNVSRVVNRILPKTYMFRQSSDRIYSDLCITKLGFEPDEIRGEDAGSRSLATREISTCKV